MTSEFLVSGQGGTETEALRDAQVACYERDDFDGSFTLSAQLPTRSPGYVESYEYGLHAADGGELLGRLGACGYLLRMSEADVLALAPALKTAVDRRIGWAS